MRLLVNGRPLELAEGCTIEQALECLSIAADFVAVAVNLECVPKSKYASTELKTGDEVEILSPHQGG